MRVLAEAEALRSRYPEPEHRPPLYGIPVGVKDLFNVDGLPTQAGSKLPPAAFSGDQSALVSSLRRAGAIVLGKTVSTEFAFFSPGPTRNPINPAYTPGGSSSGSAAAVALGLCPLALGTQTIASVNRPAAYCGVWGFKPSYGRLPLDGVFPFSQSVDQGGYFTAHHADLSFIAPLIVDAWQPVPDHSPLSLLIPQGAYLKQANAASQQQFQKILQALHKQGVQMQEIDLFPDLERINSQHKNLIAAEFALNHQALYAKYGSLYSPESRDLYLMGNKISESELKSLRQIPKALRSELRMTMHTHNANLIITPGATSTAPLGIQSTGSPLMSLPFTNMGMPTISIPFGADAAGLPYSLQLIAGFACDEFLVSAAPEVYRLLET